MRGANSGSKVKMAGRRYLCETPHLRGDRANNANGANNRGDYNGDNFTFQDEICLRPVLREGGASAYVSRLIGGRLRHTSASTNSYDDI